MNKICQSFNIQIKCIKLNNFRLCKCGYLCSLMLQYDLPCNAVFSCLQWQQKICYPLFVSLSFCVLLRSKKYIYSYAIVAFNQVEYLYLILEKIGRIRLMHTYTWLYILKTSQKQLQLLHICLKQTLYQGKVD